MTSVETGIAMILAVQVVQIVYLSSIWNRLLDYESGRYGLPLNELPLNDLPPIDRTPKKWWKTR